MNSCRRDLELSLLAFLFGFMAIPASADECMLSLKSCAELRVDAATVNTVDLVHQAAFGLHRDTSWQVMAYQTVAPSGTSETKVFLEAFSSPKQSGLICETDAVRVTATLRCQGEANCEIVPGSLMKSSPSARIAVLANKKDSCGALSALSDYFNAAVSRVDRGQLERVGRVLREIAAKENARQSESFARQPAALRQAFLVGTFTNISNIVFDADSPPGEEHYSIDFHIAGRRDLLTLELELPGNRMLSYEFFQKLP